MADVVIMIVIIMIVIIMIVIIMIVIIMIVIIMIVIIMIVIIFRARRFFLLWRCPILLEKGSLNISFLRKVAAIAGCDQHSSNFWLKRNWEFR